MPLSGAVLLASEAEKNPLIPNANELFWGTICFAIFVTFMVKFVLPKAKVALDARTEGIEGKLASAERDRDEAQVLLAQYREQLADARTEAGRIRTEAQAQRAQIVEEARAEARVEATRITESATAQIASERAQVVAELRREVGGLAVELASRVVGESLEDDARQRRTVERFLDGLDTAVPAGAAPGAVS
ncbi:MAG: synthase, subunit b [Frankiales bacterium]|jgi:F-type H+-transporting ATPase subunit b|nr:synthase, subunit b [Frankiales bacterium]